MLENNKYYIAIDLGAESGRVIVGILSNKKIVLEEIHRFPTKQIFENDTIFWDIEFIYLQIKEGIKKASAMGYNNPKGIGIDSWGVDFGLLDEKGELIENPIAYRDKRTDGMMEKVFDIIPRSNIYKTSGIQFLKFNTIFQLFSLVQNRPEIISRAKTLLMIPDLLNYLLTGKAINEYTNATTTSLINAEKKVMESEIFNKLDIPISIMKNIVLPTSKVGNLKKEISNELGIKNSKVIAVGSHDTASAIVAVPAKGKNWAYLSSGTWSLLGLEIDKPILTEKALEYSFTNEGGVNGTIRFLKNIMGLWILQRSRLIWSTEHENLNYETIIELAEKEKPFLAFFNPDDERFFNPDNMLTELENYFNETKQIAPNGVGAMGRVILENLAFKTYYYLNQIRNFSDEPIEVLHIVGGGSQNKLLNQFIANACNIEVIAGPVEATAVGNIMTQALATEDVKSLSEIRECIRNSYIIEKYKPQAQTEWIKNYKLFLDKCNLAEGK